MELQVAQIHYVRMSTLTLSMISAYGDHLTRGQGVLEMEPTRLETSSRLSLRKFGRHLPLKGRASFLWTVLIDRYCLKDGYGTRLIPQGTITAAHFVKVKSDKVSYVQVTGSGDVRIFHTLS